MAEFKFSCYRCGQHLSCEESLSGSQIQCPTCQAPLRVPSFQAAPVSASLVEPIAGLDASGSLDDAAVPNQSSAALWVHAGLAVSALVVAALFIMEDWNKREVHRVLTTLGAVYDQMTSYQDTAFVTTEVEADGKKRSVEFSTSLAVQKPDKLSLKVRSDRTELQVISDGRQTTTYASIFENQYVVRPVTEKLPDLFLGVLERSWLRLQGCLDCYSFVLGGQTQNFFRNEAKNLKLIGRERLGAKKACVVFWERPWGPFRIWVKAWVNQENGTILKMVEKFTVVASELSKLGPYTVPNTNLLKVTTVAQAIKLNGTVADEPFTFKPPAAAQKLPDFQLKSLLAVKGNLPYPASVLTRTIPPRSHRVPPGLIDLSKYFNAPLIDSWHMAGWGNDLARLPRGIQKFAGVEFDVRGIIQLCGGEVLVQYPEEVRGIKLDLKCRRIHFLHAAAYHLAEERAIGSYRIHYANHSQEEIPIVYGKDVRDWWNWDPKLPSDSVVAWTGENQSSHAGGRLVRLFKSSWTNPHPEIQIETVDFISSLVNSAPFLIAITAEVTEGGATSQLADLDASPVDLGWVSQRTETLFMPEMK